MFVSGRHLGVCPTLVQLQGLGWFRSEPVRCLWRPGGLFIWREHAFQNLFQTKEHFPCTHLGLDSSFCPLGPWWNHRAAWPHPRVRGHPHGERPHVLDSCPQASILPGSDLENLCSLSYWFCDFFKISFVFFQLCSGWRFIRLPLLWSLNSPIDMFFLLCLKPLFMCLCGFCRVYFSFLPNLSFYPLRHIACMYSYCDLWYI